MEVLSTQICISLISLTKSAPLNNSAVSASCFLRALCSASPNPPIPSIPSIPTAPSPIPANFKKDRLLTSFPPQLSFHLSQLPFQD